MTTSSGPTARVRTGLPHTFGWLLIERACSRNGFKDRWELPRVSCYTTLDGAASGVHVLLPRGAVVRYLESGELHWRVPPHS